VTNAEISIGLARRLMTPYTQHLGYNKSQSSSKLWTHNWSQVGPLCRFAPNLFAAISRAARKRSVKDGLFQNRWARDIVGASMTQGLCQYLRVWGLLRGVVLDSMQADRFVWKWSPDGKYSASSSYRAFFNGCTSLLGVTEL